MNDPTQLNNIFKLFKIDAECIHVNQFKRATTYDIQLKPGCRVKNIEKYLNEISIALKTSSKPTLQIIADQGIVRMECISPTNHKVNLFDLGTNILWPSGKLPCLLGETYMGEPLWMDLAEMPHLLVAGTTNSGKSTLLHTLIANLLTQNVSLHLMDPKNIEFFKYSNGIKNIQVAFEYEQCLDMLTELCVEMETRYQGIRSTASNYHLPYHVLIIDEFADLIMQDFDHAFQTALCKLAQKSRSAGIHIVLATQRPSATIINGAIKANFPARISCKVASGIDSRIILDTNGAEKLCGNGDAILKVNDYQRFQAAFTTPDEVCMYFKN